MEVNRPMKHPEALLLPILMLLDYYLTVCGAVLSEKKYRQHFRIEHYELNPVWQKTIAQKRWFNPRHLLLTIGLSGILIFLTETGFEPLTQWLLGVLLVLYGMIIGRHLSNLLLFHYVCQKPETLTGAVTMSHTLVLSISLYQTIILLIPFILLTLFSPSLFVVGGLTGLLLFMGVQRVWLWRANRRQPGEKSTRSNSAEDGG